MNERKLIAPPQQKRSQQTLDSLLSATISILDELGLEATVIPKIAARAGVAPASVYRRFANKDDLIRAAFLHVLRLSNENNRHHLPHVIVGVTLGESIQRLVQLLFHQYRQHPKLLRSLSRFLDNDQDEVFVMEAQTLLAANVEEIVTVMLRYRAQIAHASPEAALRFAVLQAATAIEAITLESSPLWQRLLPTTDAELTAYFADSMTTYLQRSI